MFIEPDPTYVYLIYSETKAARLLAQSNNQCAVACHKKTGAIFHATGAIPISDTKSLDEIRNDHQKGAPVILNDGKPVKWSDLLWLETLKTLEFPEGILPDLEERISKLELEEFLNVISARDSYYERSRQNRREFFVLCPR